MQILLQGVVKQQNSLCFEKALEMSTTFFSFAISMFYSFQEYSKKAPD